MHKAYKYRIYPNQIQKVLLSKTFGCVRYFWNSQVSLFNSYDKETNPNPAYKTVKEIRDELTWMKEVSHCAVQQKSRDFDEFKSQYFNKKRNKELGRPSFKKKSNAQSYRLTNQKFDLKDSKIRLEKIGWIKYVKDREIPIDSKLINVTVSQNSSGEYYVSILVEQLITQLIKTNKTVGIDVGLKEFLVEDNGNITKNPRYFRKNQAKLAKIQKNHSKKVKGSERSRKSRLKIARLHQKINNQRDNFLQTESTRLIKAFDIIYIEDLNVSGMIKNKKLSKSISDASWSKFYSMLEYKANWYGKEIVKIGRFSPSSKTCSGCGNVKETLSLGDRTYNCDSCSLVLDRDLNAAINIKALGVNNAIRTQSKVSTLCDEAFSVIGNNILL